ncbi:glycosyltransferase family 39 protein [Mucilaginibacter pallidiroseus]|uniref:Glycosyltransferase family 39 protein n=1 Tax=Mucilaginibacter pallidiroseus TaxID=2599295 RepID=A0A563UCD8_9SPHI|nr:glycosyltransferase family 39 protein [Mucilaginibacter pallidiroseus]TWR29041.1 glycosyltransferase family 39 protein [Mucilaginibacter pallidiroseus]
MSYKNRRSIYSTFVLIFVALKILINLFAIGNFGFHRDEFLHLVLADHLDWGYKEVPPFISLLAKISLSVFGDSVFASRIFTTLASGIIIWLTGQIVVELGGKRFAITLACLALIFSPAFAASGYLFQPVVFDQLWWVVTVWLFCRYLNTANVKYLYWLGAAVGLGMLTKYTMAFFTGSLIIGILISRERKLLFNKHILFSALLAFVIFLPNLIWQFAHHLPVLTHMKELREQQLDNLSPADFVMQQIMVNGTALVIWLTGFIFLFISFKLRRFRFIAIAYILIFLFLLKMSGKSYYLFGAYPMLFAAGGFAFEQFFKRKVYALRVAVIVLLVLPNILLLPLVLPILPLQRTVTFIKNAETRMPFISFLTRWEDQKQHPLTQDYADMLGWEEMAQKVAAAYHQLTPEQKKQTQIFTDSYGEAGAVNHFRRKYNLPEIISLNSSFALWAPSDLNGRYIIYVDDDDNVERRLSKIVESYKQVGEITTPLARERGVRIYLLVNPSPKLNEVYRAELEQRRLR